MKKFTRDQWLATGLIGIATMVLGAIGFVMAFVGWQDIDGPIITLSSSEKIIVATGEGIVWTLFYPANFITLPYFSWLLGFVYGLIIVSVYKIIKKV